MERVMKNELKGIIIRTFTKRKEVNLNFKFYDHITTLFSSNEEIKLHKGSSSCIQLSGRHNNPKKIHFTDY